MSESVFIPKTLTGDGGIVAGLNTAQVFWDQPGVSPIIGANTAQAMFPPLRESVGIIGWWVWFAVRPAAGDSALLRLFRYRYNGGYQVTQISDPFTIDDTSVYQIYDLKSFLRASAADFSEVMNEDHLALGCTMSGGFTLRALNQRIQFGLPGTNAVLLEVPPVNPAVWPEP
jgi:hypothetical protein